MVGAMSHAVAHPHVDRASPARRPAPLQNGDRLTREEFERRFDATPGLKRAELIEGVVHMPPPVSHEFHSSPHADLMTFLGLYRAKTPHVDVGDNGSLRLDLDNEPQPDAYLMIDHERGGQARIDEEGYVTGAPELVCEIAASSASIDMHLKMSIYRRSGVREYIVWRTYDGEIDYFALRAGEYVPIAPAEDKLLKSEIFPGLWLDRQAMLKRDMGAVTSALERGIASSEHADFVARLAQATAKRK